MLRRGPAIHRGGTGPQLRRRQIRSVRPAVSASAKVDSPARDLQPPGPPTARLIQAAAALPPSVRYDRLLRWACGDDEDGDGNNGNGVGVGVGRRPPPRVSVREYADAGGRGLVARVDAEEGDVLMAVPLSRVFCSEPPAPRRRQEEVGGGEGADEEGDEGDDEDEAPWALGMAARLLSLARTAEARLPEMDGWALWLAALPPRVVTPLEFGAREIRACGEGGAGRGVGAAILGMQRALQRGAGRARRRGELPADATDADVLWAVQALSSRCFFEPALAAHLCVPGVDMANHCTSGGGDGGGRGGGGGGAGPSARVEVRRSPDAVQGAHVGDEYFPAPPPEQRGDNESEFRLVADRALKRGEAVTISYGRWPAEVFFLLFGFIPDGDGGEDDGRPGRTEKEQEARGAAAAAGGSGPASPAPVPLPGDALLLYEGAEELADHVARLLLEASGGGDAAGESDGRARAWRAAPGFLSDEGAAAASRLACTVGGVDARLAGAVEALAVAAAAAAAAGATAGGEQEEGDAREERGRGAAAAATAAAATVPPPGELVRARVEELLEGYEAARGSGGDDDHDGRMALARSYAAAKAATARAILASLASAPRPPPPPI